MKGGGLILSDRKAPNWTGRNEGARTPTSCRHSASAHIGALTSEDSYKTEVFRGEELLPSGHQRHG